MEYAQELKAFGRGRRIRTPAVVGAVIDPGLCLDLTTSRGIQQVRYAYSRFERVAVEAGWELPRNSKDLLRRNLDCAVIRYLHQIRAEEGEPAIDTIKGVFIEGEPIYANSGFFEKTHVQICVCNPENIKGVFRVDSRFLE